MDIVVSLLVAVHVIVCLLLVLIVLMQRPKQEGLGAAFGGGMTDQVFGAQTTDVLQKGTVWLSVMFFVITMALAILISKRQSGATSIDETLSTSDTAVLEETTGLPTLPKPEEVLTVPPAGGTSETVTETVTEMVTETAGAAEKTAGEAKAAVTEAAGEAKAAGEGAATAVKESATAVKDGAKEAATAVKEAAPEAAKEAAPAKEDAEGKPAGDPKAPGSPE